MKTGSEYLEELAKDGIDYPMLFIRGYIHGRMYKGPNENTDIIYELEKENETLKKKVEFLHNQRDEILEEADCRFHTDDTEFAKSEYMNDFKKEFGEL